MSESDELLRDANRALDIGLDALECAARELVEARLIVADMITALERIVELDRVGGSAQSMRFTALDALAKAKGEV